MSTQASYIYYKAIKAFQYSTPRPDVLTLIAGDIICVPVTAKESNGWLQGILVRTKKSGLFPAAYAQQIEITKKQEENDNEEDDDEYYYYDEEESEDQETDKQQKVATQPIQNTQKVETSVKTTQQQNIKPPEENDEEGEYYYEDTYEESVATPKQPTEASQTVNPVTIEKIKRDTNNLTPLVTAVQSPEISTSLNSRPEKENETDEYYEYYDEEESLQNGEAKRNETLTSGMATPTIGTVDNLINTPTIIKQDQQQTPISRIQTPLASHSDEVLKARQSAFDEMASNLRQESQKRAEFELEVLKLRQKLEFYEESLKAKDNEIKNLQGKIEQLHKKNETLSETCKATNEKIIKLEISYKRAQDELQTIMGYEIDKPTIDTNTASLETKKENTENEGNEPVQKSPTSSSLPEIKFTKHRIEELERENLNQLNINDELNSKLIEMSAQLDYNKGEAEKYRKLEEVLLLNDIEPLEILETIDRLEQENQKPLDLSFEQQENDEKDNKENQEESIEDIMKSKNTLTESELMQKKKEALSQTDAEKLCKYTENNKNVTNLLKIKNLQQELYQKELIQHKLERLINSAGINSSAVEEKQKWEETARLMEKDLIKMKLEVQVVRAAENGIDIAPLVKNVTKRRRKRKNIFEKDMK